MSADITSERVCYLRCNFCNTILAVNVPCNSLLTLIVTVRCGHCANLLSVNMGALFHSAAAIHLQSATTEVPVVGGPLQHHLQPHEQPKTPPIHPPEKRQRVPSAYNRFIKDEIQRIKASNPEISHREAFSTAAKNWAHFPRINLGQRLHLQDHQANSGQTASATATNRYNIN